MRTDAVLFDLDGTLLDTEKYLRRAWPEASERFGYRMSDEEALSMRSLGRPFAVSYLEDTIMKGRCGYTELRDLRREIFREMVEKEGLQAKRGAEELLAYLKEAGITAAVVTASGKEYAENYLGQLGLLHYFDHIISATMVKQGKPAPDVYLYACEVLGLESGNCIAVEDSPNGIRSAAGAGCRVIMVPDQAPPTEEDRAFITAELEKLDDIIGYLKG